MGMLARFAVVVLITGSGALGAADRIPAWSYDDEGRVLLTFPPHADLASRMRNEEPVVRPLDEPVAGMTTGATARRSGPLLALAILLGGGRDLASQAALTQHAIRLWGDHDPATLGEQITAESTSDHIGRKSRHDLDRLVAIRLAQAGDHRDLAPAIEALLEHEDRHLARAARQILAGWGQAEPSPLPVLPPLEESLASIPAEADLIVVLDGRQPLSWQDPGQHLLILASAATIADAISSGGNVHGGDLMDSYLGTSMSGEAPLTFAHRHGNLRIDRSILVLDVNADGSLAWQAILEGDFTAEQIQGLASDLLPPALLDPIHHLEDGRLVLGSLAPPATAAQAITPSGIGLAPAAAGETPLVQVRYQRDAERRLPMPVIFEPVASAHIDLVSAAGGSELRVRAEADDPDTAADIAALMTRPLPPPHPRMNAILRGPEILRERWIERGWQIDGNRLDLTLTWPTGDVVSFLRQCSEPRPPQPGSIPFTRDEPFAWLRWVLSKDLEPLHPPGGPADILPAPPEHGERR